MSKSETDVPARKKRTEHRILPGDLPAEKLLERIVRVDHAGEYGAVRIYEGQLAVLGNSEKGDVIRHMAEQEREHLDRFSELIGERRVRGDRVRGLRPGAHV